MDADAWCQSAAAHEQSGLLVGDPLAVRPGLEAGSVGRACLYGVLFGFSTYATYDLTNLATLRDWPVLVAVVDITWGTVLGTLVSGGAYLIGTWLGRG